MITFVDQNPLHLVAELTFSYGCFVSGYFWNVRCWYSKHAKKMLYL